MSAENQSARFTSEPRDAVQSLDSERVILLPDEYLGDYVARHSDVEIIRWEALEPKVEVPAAIADRARQALQAMLGVSR